MGLEKVSELSINRLIERQSRQFFIKKGIPWGQVKEK